MLWGVWVFLTDLAEFSWNFFRRNLSGGLCGWVGIDRDRIGVESGVLPCVQ
jgi:hypothetical protein